MSSNHDAPQSAQAARALTERGYSYSRRRWNAFDAWQAHVRKAAASTRAAADTVATAFSVRHDRDLRRVIVTG